MAVDHIEEAEGAEQAEGLTAQSAEAVVESWKLYSIAPGYSVNVRSGPSTTYPLVRVLAPGSRVHIYCQRDGQSVSGPYGTSRIWDSIGNGQYVSDVYVNTGSDGYVAQRCL